MGITDTKAQVCGCMQTSIIIRTKLRFQQALRYSLDFKENYENAEKPEKNSLIRTSKNDPRIESYRNEKKFAVKVLPPVPPSKAPL
jgi:hypothetical protein